MNSLALDKDLFLIINGFVGRVPIFDNLIKLIVNEYFVPITLALVILFLWFSSDKNRSSHRKVLPIVFFSVFFVNLIIIISNLFVERARPFDELHTNLLFYKPTDPSFPSNAAAVGFALALSIYLVNKKLGVGAIILAAFYSFSRVYAGVHFPSDVLVGALLGIFSALLISRWRVLIKGSTLFIEKIQSTLKLDL